MFFSVLTVELLGARYGFDLLAKLILNIYAS